MPEQVSKSKLRDRFRTLRAEVSRNLQGHWGPAERDELFAFLAPYLGDSTPRVLSYFAVGSEPSILPRAASEVWYFPTVVQDTLHWFPWSPAEALPQAGKHGRRELPVAKPWRCVTPAPGSMGGGVCFVPQLAVDAKGYRLGYGGGYYDRFLGDPSVSSALLLVACSHEDLMVPDLPREPHDIPVDIIVTRKDLRLLISVDQMLSKLGIANEKRSASRVPSGSL